MSGSDHIAAYFWVSAVSGGRHEIIDKIRTYYGTFEKALESSFRGEKAPEDCFSGKMRERIESEVFRKKTWAVMKRVEETGTKVVCGDDPLYPKMLLEYPAHPMILFYEGYIEGIDAAYGRLGVVGTRNCSVYGRETCFKLVSCAKGHDICIVSGLARGIDSCAHRAALEAGLFTAAVLGCGTNVIYPPENAGLYKAIRDKGVIISEQPPDTEPFKSFFPARNRIIAGLSDAVLVVEAGLSSGALITADFALDAGRDVLAVPHRIDAPQGAGCNDLLKNGAVMVTSPGDVLNQFGIEEKETGGRADMLVEALDERQRAVLGFIRKNGDSCEDTIIAETGFSSVEIKRALSSLEIFGFIKSDRGGRYFAV